ncbi:hypothetical protein MKW98_027350, partial [Papaver atlanticum]
AVYTPFLNLMPKKTAQNTVKALVLKMWKFENKRSGKVWSLELHLIDQHLSSESLSPYPTL